MKFMLNGALTIGTLDGANVEMLEQAGEDNIFIFGLKADEVAARLRYNNGDEVKDIYSSNHGLRKVLDQLISGEMNPENPQIFRDLYQTLLFGDYGNPDVYMVLRDFEEYCNMQNRLSELYKDRTAWVKKAIMNTASSGYFSSDRTTDFF
jgi:starch phosphorylase